MFGNKVCLYARTTTFLQSSYVVGNFGEAKSTVLNALRTEDGAIDLLIIFGNTKGG
jgi:hypothetical protein